MKQTRESFDSLERAIKANDITIEDKLDERLSCHIEGYLSELFEDIAYCESPIEKIFSIEFGRELKRSDLNYQFHYINHQPQYEITLFEGRPREVTYRLDFLVDYHNHRTGADYKFAIECDGHDFHEKTKKQASRDKQKDRNLMLNGIIPIRFTGSEIFDEPFKCAVDAVRIIENYIFKMYRHD